MYSADRPPGAGSPSFKGRWPSRRFRRLHVSFNPIRLKDKNMQQIEVLQRPLRV
ncbi:hypothetical protein GOB05_18990 [Sinorhizobium meliloti]|nr:hypothetical protein [Sinorhizobium meliloti]